MSAARIPVGSDLRSVKVVHVIKCVHLVGTGLPTSPLREVTTWWSLDGTKLAEADPLTEEAASA